MNLEAAWRRDPFMAIKCAFMLRCLKKPGQCKHARKHLDDWLAFGNYAGTGIHYLKLPHACLIPFRRRMLSHMLSLQSDIHVLEKKWIASRIRFCVGKMPTFKDDWNHAKLCRASGPWPQSSAPPIPECIPGTVERVDRNWQVPKRMAKAEELEFCHGKLLEIKNHMKCAQKKSFPAKAVLQIPVPQEVRRHWQAQDTSQLHFLQYTHDMNVPAGTAAVPDDKAKKSWLENANCVI